MIVLSYYGSHFVINVNIEYSIRKIFTENIFQDNVYHFINQMMGPRVFFYAIAQSIPLILYIISSKIRGRTEPLHERSPG